MTRTPLRSMTGFGEAERDLEAGRLRVEVRTVNHRFLNLQLRPPPGLERHLQRLEGALRARFARGHVSVTVALDRKADLSSPRPVLVDRARAKAYVEALRSLQGELGLSGTVEVGMISSFRDIFQADPEAETAPAIDPEVLIAVLDEAAVRASRVREEEGARIGKDLGDRLTALEASLSAIEGRAPARLVAERDRLRSAIAALLDGRIPVDEDRLAREVAHLAERWDIHEEVVRFRAHVEMFREVLERGDPTGVGKRLGFLSQELLREANTIGAKANDTEIAHAVVGLKEELDRLREQLENLE